MEEKTKARIREIRKRVWKEKSRKIKIFLFLFLILFLFWGMIKVKNLFINFLWNSEIFRIKEVEIVPEKAKNYILPVIEIEKDKNLLFLDARTLKKMIENIAMVEKCRIKKVYPDKLYIEVKIRQPFVCVVYMGNFYIVDRNGVIINTESNKPDTFVYGVIIDENTVSKKDLWKIKFLNELEKWYNFYNLKARFTVKEIHFISANEIILITEKGKIKVRREGLQDQFEKLLLLLKNYQGNWNYIDLRFKDIYGK